MSDLGSPQQVVASQPLIQRLGAILWPSFFSAGVCTMVLFAVFDPLVLGKLASPRLPYDRGLVYTLGFFAFWSATAASSFFTWILLRRCIPPNSRGRPPG